MKRLILSICLLASVATQAQVQFAVTAPASIAGPMAFTDNGATGDWGLIDLLNPADAVLDTCMLAEDGTPGVNAQGIDSTYESCDTVTNDLTGKIAVIYRNTCSFGLKCLNAQDAGAVAVIIINREPGLVNMLGGAEGLLVNIPVTFISQADGAILRARMDAGDDVVVFIGNKFGFFNDDIGYGPGDVLRAENASTPRQLAQTAADFYVPMGANVYNYGNNNQTDVVLTATIEYGGSAIYSQSSTPMAMNSGDTLFIPLPTFSQATYGIGYYDVTYSVNMGVVDELNADNNIEADFQISSDLLSLGQLDSTMVPEAGSFFRAVNGAGNTDFTTCVHFQDSIASRLAVEGMWFAASGGFGDSLTGTYVQLFVYEWTDVFTGIDDAAYDNANLILTEVASGEYDYLSDLQNEFVYAPVLTSIGTQLTLNDNTRYLFCIEVAIEDVFISYDADADYTINQAYYLQPLAPIQADLTWNANGFGSQPIPSTAIQVTGVNAVSEVTRPSFVAYPNPAGDIVTFRLGNNVSLTSLNILDITGNLVKTRALNNNGAGSIALDVSELANGQYIFSLTEKDGTVSNLKVTIAK
ncbi:MAG: hypothetical protein ACI9J3_001072 [Parvicellaceae bacterium]|jgi:hypothetical protein